MGGHWGLTMMGWLPAHMSNSAQECGRKKTLGQELQQISDVAIDSHVIASKPPCFPGLQFPHLSNADEHANLSRLLWGLHPHIEACPQDKSH